MLTQSLCSLTTRNTLSEIEPVRYGAGLKKLTAVGHFKSTAEKQVWMHARENISEEAEHTDCILGGPQSWNRTGHFSLGIGKG